MDDLKCGDVCICDLSLSMNTHKHSVVPLVFISEAGRKKHQYMLSAGSEKRRKRIPDIRLWKLRQANVCGETLRYIRRRQYCSAAIQAFSVRQDAWLRMRSERSWISGNRMIKKIRSLWS